ncbi:MAG: hypothetical protein ABIH21_01695 [Patescibacteria group bacterium]
MKEERRRSFQMQVNWNNAVMRLYFHAYAVDRSWLDWLVVGEVSKEVASRKADADEMTWHLHYDECQGIKDEIGQEHKEALEAFFTAQVVATAQLKLQRRKAVVAQFESGMLSLCPWTRATLFSLMFYAFLFVPVRFVFRTIGKFFSLIGKYLGFYIKRTVQAAAVFALVYYLSIGLFYHAGPWAVSGVVDAAVWVYNIDHHILAWQDQSLLEEINKARIAHENAEREAQWKAYQEAEAKYYAERNAELEERERKDREYRERWQREHPEEYAAQLESERLYEEQKQKREAEREAEALARVERRSERQWKEFWESAPYFALVLGIFLFIALVAVFPEQILEKLVLLPLILFVLWFEKTRVGAWFVIRLDAWAERRRIRVEARAERWATRWEAFCKAVGEIWEVFAAYAKAQHDKICPLLEPVGEKPKHLNFE